MSQLEPCSTLCYSAASMLSVPEPQIRALIRLLSDGDERVARTIAGKLAEIGEPAVPLLREAELEQPEMAARISEVLDDIQGQRLEGDFPALSACDGEHLDLETRPFLIPRVAYPDLDVDPYVRVLDAPGPGVRDRLGRKGSGGGVGEASNADPV